MTGDEAVALQNILEELGHKKLQEEGSSQNWKCFIASTMVINLWHHLC